MPKHFSERKPEEQEAIRAAAADGEQERPKRKDARRRPLGGPLLMADVRDKDPNKHYVWVSKSRSDVLATYEAMGYEPVERQKGGPKTAGGRTAKDGEVIGNMDTILMCIDKDEREAFDAQGREEADAKERAILAKQYHGESDPMRGRHVDGLRLQDKSRITNLHPEG